MSSLRSCRGRRERRTDSPPPLKRIRLEETNAKKRRDNNGTDASNSDTQAYTRRSLRLVQKSELLAKKSERKSFLKPLAADGRCERMIKLLAPVNQPSVKLQQVSGRLINDDSRKPRKPEVTNKNAVRANKGPGGNSHVDDVVPKKAILEFLKNEFTCCICNEIMIEATVTRCGHMFCSYCLQKSKKRSTSCPLCRSQRISEHAVKSIDEFINKIMMNFFSKEYAMRLKIIEERKGKVTARTPTPGRPKRPTKRSPILGST